MSPPESTAVAEQFETAEQQRHAATLGMWVFLATEVLFFGTLFLGYTVYRSLYPDAFHEASSHTLLAAGAINTAILLGSSFTMVLGVRAAELGRRKSVVLLLGATALLGVLFLGIKGFEYATEIREGFLPGDRFRFPGPESSHARIFFSFYFTMTGLHALHVSIGIVCLLCFAFRAYRAVSLEKLTTSIDLLGLYWHFVDVVWVFLFPLIYLVGHRA